METTEFLGGKYQKTEQIVPGPVQTFRAREAGSGRDVFVHRVSTTEEPAEQMALLRMLTTVLLRSAEARRLVLDFGDDQGFWYVVTQSEPRCLILREWLQFEQNRQDNGPVPAKEAQGAPRSNSAPPDPTPEETAPGEFTKLFHASHPTTLKESSAKESSAPSSSMPSALPERAAATPTPTAPSEPGEFTRVFQSLKPQAAPPAPVTSPAAPIAQVPKEEQGEFTKLFQGGLPSAGKTPSNPEIRRSQDRSSRGGFVQRPNTPMPPVPQKSVAEPGEFTRIFAHPVPESQKPKDVFADYPISTANSRDLFSGGDLPKPKTPEAHEPGEYTRIFGGGTVSPPIEQPPAAAKTVNPTPMSLDDPLQGTRHFSPAPAAPPPVQRGPSEYTMVIQGNRVAEEAGAGNSPAAGSVPPPNAPALPKIPALPQVKAPQVSVPKPPAVAALAQVKTPAPAGNKKLIVFFAILAVLAAVLIVLVVLIAVKK